MGRRVSLCEIRPWRVAAKWLSWWDLRAQPRYGQDWDVIRQMTIFNLLVEYNNWKSRCQEVNPEIRKVMCERLRVTKSGIHVEPEFIAFLLLRTLTKSAPFCA